MGPKLPIYLDYNATTPVDERVLEAMMPHLTTEFGNASSESHVFGRKARAAVENARQQVAGLIGAAPGEIVFTSGATESCNLAIKGVVGRYHDQGNHLVTSMVEHGAVLDTCQRLERHGFDVAWLKPDKSGRVSPGQVVEAITDRTILVSIMAANNVIGTINPIADIAEAVRERGVLFHTDATQAVGKIPVDVAAGIDLLSLSGHKIYGPKGVGVLYVRSKNPRVRLECQMDGGGQERALRSGTLNVPGIAGLGAACAICREELAEESARVLALRDRFEKGLLGGLDHVRLNGHPTERLPNTVNLSFEFVDGEALMMKLGDVAVSPGAACSSDSHDPNYVLKAMGVPEELASTSIRCSAGRFTTAGEIDYAVEKVVQTVNDLRQRNARYQAEHTR